MLRTLLLTALAMLAFAANSLLARLALESGTMDAWSYTCVRLLAGAVTLFILAGIASRGKAAPIAGSWSGAAALFGYALAFSLAYLLVGAGTGALILFASVQFAMLTWGVVRGDRPGPLEWLGIAIALSAFAYLVSPGLVAPHPVGAALMVVSGLCWAAYSLIGRGSRTPLADTTGNFLRSAPAAIGIGAWGAATSQIDLRGVVLAIASGAIASGIGYAIWYAVLPSLTRTRAAIVQLTVPAIAALGGVLLLGEILTPRLLLASIAILGGVAMAIVTAERRKRVAVVQP